MNDSRNRIPGRRPRRSASIVLVALLALVLPAATEIAAGGCGQGGGNAKAGCCGKCGGKADGRAAGGPAAGPGSGHGRRHRGAGPGGGRNADGHHEAIQTLLAEHGKIRRQVELIEGGVQTVTTSEDPDVAATLREHVGQMQARMEAGNGVRHWDPLFVEIFARHDQIRMVVEEVPGGVRVRETSDAPEVASLIRQHAIRGVSEFVERGFDRAHETTPLPEGYGVNEVTADRSP